jgi:hypothetical protein
MLISGRKGDFEEIRGKINIHGKINQGICKPTGTQKKWSSGI